MRVIRLLLFAAIAIGLMLLLWNKDPKKPQQTQTAPQPLPNISTAEQHPQLQSQTPTANHPVERSNPTNPGLLEVNFENRDGLAVAWGDVILGQLDSEFNRDRGAARITPPNKWPQPRIPYWISPKLAHPDRVRSATARLAHDTSAQLYELQLTQVQDGTDMIVFEPTSDAPESKTICLSALGRTGGMQPIRLGSECREPEILHEILHALGFIHEHSRADRDAYLTIHWDRIDPKYQSQFSKVPTDWKTGFEDTPFDPHSIMLYSSDLFSIKPGLPALTLKNQATGAEEIIPATTQLSEQDRERVNQLWNPPPTQ